MSSAKDPMARANQIFTLMKRKALYHKFEDLSKGDKDLLKRFLADKMKIRARDEEDKAGGEEWSWSRDLDDVLAYLAGSGNAKDLPWMIGRIREFEKKGKVRIDRLSHLSHLGPSSKTYSAGLSLLDTALLARDDLKKALFGAYEKMLAARERGMSAFAAGLQDDGQNELAARVSNIGAIEISDEQEDSLEIGGDDSHSDFSQFAAGYGLTPEELENDFDLLESTVTLWKDFGRPEMDDAFIKGFIFSMLE